MKAKFSVEAIVLSQSGRPGWKGTLIVYEEFSWEIPVGEKDLWPEEAIEKARAYGLKIDPLQRKDVRTEG